jgi:hypothetical protein
MNSYSGENVERLPLSDVLANHLNGCGLCQENLTRKPIANLGGSKTVCSERLTIIAEWAATEGRINNIVARDEYGNEARKGL